MSYDRRRARVDPTIKRVLAPVEDAVFDLDTITFEAMRDIMVMPPERQEEAAENLAEAIGEHLQSQNQVLKQIRRRYRSAKLVAARWLG